MAVAEAVAGPVPSALLLDLACALVLRQSFGVILTDLKLSGWVPDVRVCVRIFICFMAWAATSLVGLSHDDMVSNIKGSGSVMFFLFSFLLSLELAPILVRVCVISFFSATKFGVLYRLAAVDNDGDANGNDADADGEDDDGPTAVTVDAAATEPRDRDWQGIFSSI